MRERLTIRKGGLLYRYFRFCLQACATFMDKSSMPDKYENGTNLCHFCRVILIYAPLVVLARLVAIGGVLTVTIIIPAVWFGLAGYQAVLILILVAAVGGGVLIIFFMGVGAAARKVKKSEVVGECTMIIKERLIAADQKICPLLDFKEIPHADKEIPHADVV